MGKTQQFQYEIMVEFMEKHGDLQWLPHDRLDNLKKWHELVDLLNNHATKGVAKPLDKWRKAWSDFKNNTRRKEMKIKQGAEMTTILTALEQRVLRLMEDNKKHKRHTSLNNSDILLKVQTDSDSFKRSPPLKRRFASVDEHDYASHGRRKSTSSTSSSSASSTDPIDSARPTSKRKNTEITPETVRDVTDRFFKYEREKEKMAHEQEMARIKQNEKLLSIVDRMVNVLETLAPNIQKYLNHNTNDNR